MNRLGRGWVSVLALLTGIVVLVAGCSGVPRSSAPQVVRAVNGVDDQAGANTDPGPASGADPRTVLTGFLHAAVVSRSASRQYLTSEAQRKWQDNTVIIVNDDYRVPAAQAEGTAASFAIMARRVGQLDATGTYSPVLKGDGSGDQETFTFGLIKAAGQWRVDQLQAGVLVTVSDFKAYYRSTILYFYDTSESGLVPDVRYSSLGRQPLASWLMAQMLLGPRPELTSTVVNEIPDQGVPSKVTVTVADQIKVEIPGSSQLEGPARQRLAVQLSYTLAQVQVSEITLTDGGRPVRIPQAGTVFSTANFPGLGQDGFRPDVARYYVYRQALIAGSSNLPVAGPLGTSAAGLASIAVRQSAGRLKVAALVAGRLEIGDAVNGLVRVPMPAGVESKPEWRPQSTEVWVGVGTGGIIYRVTAQGPKPVVSTSSRGPTPVGQVIALRFSPEGDRLAVVYAAVDGTSAVWMGSVVRSGNDVRIDGFEPITPTALKVADVGWVGNSLLMMVAADTSRGPTENSMWSLQSDGSLLEQRSSIGLPSAPQTLACAPGQLSMVGGGGTISIGGAAGGWTSLSGSGTTAGSDPAYTS